MVLRVQRFKPVGVTNRWQKWRTFERKRDAQRAVQVYTGRYRYKLTKTNKGWTIYLKKK